MIGNKLSHEILPENLVRLISICNILYQQVQMGCEQSRLNHHQATLSYSVIDPAFLKPSNKIVRASLESSAINVKTYMSVDCFISDQVDSYSNNVVIPQSNLPELLQGLKQISSNPKIFVLGKGKLKTTDTEQNLARITYIQSYEELKQFDQKAEPPMKESRKKQVIDLKLLKDFRGDGEPQLFIFQQTLKSKGITFKVYSTFQDLENEMSIVESRVVVTDYVFQNQVVDLLINKKTKVICYCNLDSQETYHPNIYFITNNFQQIANQVAMLKSFTQPPLTITKIFLCSKNPHFSRFKQTLEEFQLQCREFKELRQILKISKYFFSLVILCPLDEKPTLEKQLEKDKLAFRVQLLGIDQQTQNSPRGLRKIIREIKRGYLLEKGICKSVDIIDKYHNCSKFQDIKAELQKNSISYRCYEDFYAYNRKLLYCSPFIITNYSERNLVYRFLEQSQSKSKIIIFCNKSRINQQLLAEKKWAFVSSHFSKILSYLKSKVIAVPVILDQNQQRIILKQEKIRNKQHRISAIKWSDPNIRANSYFSVKSINQNLRNGGSQVFQVSYIVSKSNITQHQVKQICHDASTLLKLDYNPVANLEKFRKELAVSIQFLKEKYKLKYSQTAFAYLLDEIKQNSIRGLSKRVREFFGEEKGMGFKLNESLKTIQTLDEKQLRHLREIIYLINYNFIAYYQMPKIGSFKLVHWTKETLLQNFLDQGIVIFKNFLVMFEEGSFQPLQDCLKLQMQIQYDTLNDQNTNFSPYFYYEGRYIFAPYTQFRLKDGIKENEAVVSLQLVKQSNFLDYYYTDNVSQNLKEYFENQVKANSTLIQGQESEKIQKHLLRADVLKLWQACDYTNAIEKQIELIKIQEQTQNMDQRYLIELFYELANYQFKAGLADDFLSTVQQITANDPCPFIRNKCTALLQKLAIQIQKEQSQKQQPNQARTQRTQKCIELKQNLEQVELEQNLSLDNHVPKGQNFLIEQNCLQMEDIQQHFEFIK